MPTYELLALLRADTTPRTLTELFRGVARVVFREHGQFRTIENLGVRPLAYRTKQKGGAYHEDARFVQCTYDISPDGLATVEERLTMSPDLLRWAHYRQEGFKPGRKEKVKLFKGVVALDSPMFDVERYSEPAARVGADAVPAAAASAGAGRGGDAGGASPAYVDLSAPGQGDR